MTKKDYIRAAAVVRDQIQGSIDRDLLDRAELVHLHRTLVDAMISFFQGDNPRFDADRFRDACKVVFPGDQTEL